MNEVRNRGNSVFVFKETHMKHILMILLLTISLLACIPQEQVSDVQIYEGPKTMKSSEHMQVFVNDEELFVYETRVNFEHVWSWKTPETIAPVVIFDFLGTVNMTIHLPFNPQEAVIKPLAHNKITQIQSNQVSFSLDKPGSYIVEFDQDEKKVLHIFTQSIDNEVPYETDQNEDMIFFGPGEHDIGTYELYSNQTVYIAGGAVIHGKFIGYQVQHVTIKGRGIITGENYDRTETQAFIPLEFQHSSHINIEGITVLDPAGWAIHSYFNSDLRITDIHIITARQNGDGISLQSNQRVYVANSFVRSWDDSLVVKNYDLGSSSQILFEDMILWTDLAQSMEVGYETYGDFIDDVIFRNITVLYNFHKAVISIHNGDQALITNITFDNIIIEKAYMNGDQLTSINDDFLIDIGIVDHPLWSTSNDRGYISEIVIQNVFVLEGLTTLKIKISGYDDLHSISNVTFENILMYGKNFNFVDPFFEINSYVSEISY
ncbi:MAG: glycosyl hydrolase family 28 protein [Acholeplasmataceae bacterium]